MVSTNCLLVTLLDEVWGGDERGDVPFNWSVVTGFCVLVLPPWRGVGGGTDGCERRGWSGSAVVVVPWVVGFDLCWFMLWYLPRMKSIWEEGSGICVPVFGSEVSFSKLSVGLDEDVDILVCL